MRALTMPVLCVALSLKALAQTGAVAILDASTSAILGGVKNGRFVKAQEAVKGMKKGDSFTYFGIYSQNLSGRKLTDLDQSGNYCKETAMFEVTPGETSGVMIGANANWDPIVRNHDLLWDGFQPSWAELKYWTNQTYRKAVVDFLKTRAIANALARITQAFRVDLDGDGADEVVVVANNFNPGANPNGRPGDYSFVLVRKVVGNLIKNILIEGELDYRNFPEGGPILRDITAIVDLNGDGRMEIVVHGTEANRSSTSVYEISNNVPSLALKVSCGL